MTREEPLLKSTSKHYSPVPAPILSLFVAALGKEISPSRTRISTHKSGDKIQHALVHYRGKFPALCKRHCAILYKEHFYQIAPPHYVIYSNKAFISSSRKLNFNLHNLHCKQRPPKITTDCNAAKKDINAK